MLGDTLLHYAAKKNDSKVAMYIVKKCPNSRNVQNLKGILPIDMTTDPQIKNILKSGWLVLIVFY